MCDSNVEGDFCRLSQCIMFCILFVQTGVWQGVSLVVPLRIALLGCVASIGFVDTFLSTVPPSKDTNRKRPL